MQIDEMRNCIHGRPIYIWGTRIAGLSAAKYLLKQGFKIEAFIDSTDCSGHKLGIPVLLPDELFKKKLKRIFILICTRGHSPQIAQICLENGLTRNDFIEWEKIQRFDYYIEINNRCNLSCMTCSSREYYNQPLINMGINDFKAVLAKIRKEDPLASWINLFGHNEAFLNPALDEMIEISNSYNFCVGLSTNLAFSRDFKSVVKAKPVWIRVSASGWGKNYELMHRGGKFDILMKNLEKLSQYRDKYSKETLIEFFFHRYRHNKNDIPHVKQLCKALGFEFRCIYASVIGFETVSNILDGRAISQKTQVALPYLCHSVEATAQKAFTQRNLPCPNDHLVRIHSDMTIAECQAWMGSVMPDVKFTEIGFDALERKLANTRFCKICKSRGLHQFCEIVFDEEAASGDMLGDLPN